MKALLVSSFAVAVIVAASAGTPIAAGPTTPETLIPSALGFFDASHGVLGTGSLACSQPVSVISIPPCQRGAILATSDGGRTTRIVMRTHGPISSVAVAGDQAWAFAFRCQSTLGLCEQGSLLHSTDRGRTWRPISRLPLFDISFADTSHGLGVLLPNACAPVCDPFTSLAASADGGKTWSRVDTPCGHNGTSGLQVAGVSLVSLTRAWLLCVGRVKTTRSGSLIHQSADKAVYRIDAAARAWKRVVSVSATGAARDGLPPSGTPSGISFAANGTGVMWEQLGSQYLTRDGGLHWHALEPVEKEDGLAGTVAGRRIELLLAATPHQDSVRLARTSATGGRLVSVRTWRLR